MTLWTRRAAQILRPRRTTAPLVLESAAAPAAAAAARISLRSGTVAIGDRTRACSTQAAASSMLPAEQWKVVYRAFLLHVHPDFFHHQPEKRAINERNLKTFQQHLYHLEHRSSRAAAEATYQDRGSGALASSSARLVFFLKPEVAHDDPQRSNQEENTNGNSNSNSNSSESHIDNRQVARKLILPLESHRTMAILLHEAGISPTHPPPSQPQHAQPTAQGSSPSRVPSDGTSEWEDWTEDLFGRAASSRAREEAESRHRRTRRYAASDNVEGAYGEGRQKTTEWGAAAEEHEGYDASRLGYILATDAGRTLVRERRSSARSVQELVRQLRDQYGFGEFTFRQALFSSRVVQSRRVVLEHRRVVYIRRCMYRYMIYSYSSTCSNSSAIQTRTSSSIILSCLCQ